MRRLREFLVVCGLVLVTEDDSFRCRKQFQKLLAKQGLKFKLNTKVLSAEKKGGKIYLQAEPAKGGAEETVGFLFNL